MPEYSQISTTDYEIKEDTSGNLGIFNNGLEIAYFTKSNSSYGGAALFLRDQANNIIEAIEAAYGGLRVRTAVSLDSILSQYKEISTAGLGIAPILADVDLTAQSATISNLCSASPATNAKLRVSGYLNITSFTSGSVTLNVNYSDETGTVQNITLPFLNNGTLQNSANALKNFQAPPVPFRVKAGSTITVQVTGTFVATFDIGVTIEQLNAL
ncbi:MAG: hypothetical protein ACYCQJ_02625 [Nitrososphaerales archaeon]